MSKNLIIRGARSNNLKNIDVEIPRDKLTVFTGLSGSGKSTLAFDTIYAEGHRRFVESLSSYARQFLGQLDKPDVDIIEGLSPAISIDQKTTSKNPRSTVGTVTEIYDYLRLLYARVGIPHCPVCKKEIRPQTVDSICDKIMAMPEGTRFMILAPVVRGQKGTHEKILADIRRMGYARVRIDGNMYDVSEEIKLEKNNKHTIEVIIDRLVMKDSIRSRVSDSLESAFALTDGRVLISNLSLDEDDEKRELEYSCKYACEEHNISFGELEPRMFSFNNPYGACPECAGLGDLRIISEEKIIPNRELSISKGAIVCNGFKGIEAESWMGPLINAVGEEFGFDIDTPISKYSPEAYNALLYGTVPKLYRVRSYFGKATRDRETMYEGVIPIIRRRMGQMGEGYYDEFLEDAPCPKCNGRRLSDTVLSVTVGGLNIDEICRLPIKKMLDFVEGIKFTETELAIAREILKEIKARLNFLCNVGLDYLDLARKAGTLSGGEAQRIRLATQIGSGLVGVLYILDEPSIGLHQRDNDKLIATLKNLRDIGNTVIVVEHDEDTIKSADFVVDIGPGAGIHGGELVVAGTPEEVAKCKQSITGAYLSGRKTIKVPEERKKGNGKFLRIVGAKHNNLKNITVDIPLGCLVCVTGVSGSGKSSLVNYVLQKTLARELNGATTYPGKCERIEGIEHLDKVIDIDQSPIGRTPRSNPATYTGLFTDIRNLFASTRDAKARGYQAGRFSFNVKGGRCEACEGDGVKRIEMHFLPDVYVKCDVCKGKRYNRDTLDVKYKGKNIYEVLEMTVEEGVSFFDGLPKITNKLKALYDVGLGYIKIGQSSTTLSGGEAQRVKLATELARRGTGSTIYILDEPTTGLHTADVARLVDMLYKLVENGNTVVVIEHNLDLIKTADHIIDLGPEGGEGGGCVVASGTPEQVAMCENSYTGRYIGKKLNSANKNVKGEKADDAN